MQVEGACAHMHFIKVVAAGALRGRDGGRSCHLWRVAVGAACGVEAARLLPGHLAVLPNSDDLAAHTSSPQSTSAPRH